MQQPKGCEDGINQVCRLIKPLYSLKQAGCEWNDKLDVKLKVHDYKCLFADPCAYIWWDAGNFGILTVWVDDSLLFASSDSTMDRMKEMLHSEWEVTDLGEPSKIVSIKVTHSDNSISISQAKYIENLLQKEWMSEVNPVCMPMDPHIQLVPNLDDNEHNRSNSFSKLLGCLQFIANSTRPDISYAVNRLTAYTANPGLEHHSAIKQILQYLAGMKTLGITYWKSQDVTEANNLFHGYADAAYANAKDLKSMTGYVFLAAGGVITWKSKKQSVIVLSSTEAEYIVLSEAGHEAMWLRNLYGELGFPQQFVTVIKGDNDGSVVLTHNPQFHQQSKHIAICHHWIQDLVANKVLNIKNCCDPEQTTDVLTKALPNPKHSWHQEEMGIQPIS
jgi:Reverse transcriptase (RNA-dependent DNA polymerase)